MLCVCAVVCWMCCGVLESRGVEGQMEHKGEYTKGVNSGSTKAKALNV